MYLFGMPGGGEYFFLSFLLVGFLATIFWLFALISILRNSFKNPNDKLVWLLIVIFIPLLGSLLYFFIGRNQIIKEPFE